MKIKKRIKLEKTQKKMTEYFKEETELDLHYESCGSSRTEPPTSSPIPLRSSSIIILLLNCEQQIINAFEDYLLKCLYASMKKYTESELTEYKKSLSEKKRKKERIFLIFQMKTLVKTL